VGSGAAGIQEKGVRDCLRRGDVGAGRKVFDVLFLDVGEEGWLYMVALLSWHYAIAG
jgi:hypothetical protein